MEISEVFCCVGCLKNLKSLPLPSSLQHDYPGLFLTVIKRKENMNGNDGLPFVVPHHISFPAAT